MRNNVAIGPTLLIATLAGSVMPLFAGCASVPPRATAPERYDNGIVFILPGIEGRSQLNASVATGLYEGGVRSAIEIYDWTLGVPGSFMLNLADLERNRQQGAALAERIVEYRREHPGRPVQIIGHSGGGGIAILTLEALPPGRQIDAALLLAPALSPDYNLSAALLRTRFGIYNFRSERDVGLLKVATTVFGSIDRHAGAAAGAVGFELPAGITAAERELYDKKLEQVAWTERLRRYGADGSHAGWTTRQFARSYLAPIVRKFEQAHVRGDGLAEVPLDAPVRPIGSNTAHFAPADGRDVNAGASGGLGPD